jgi:hypothetical protein
LNDEVLVPQSVTLMWPHVKRGSLPVLPAGAAAWCIICRLIRVYRIHGWSRSHALFNCQAATEFGLQDEILPPVLKRYRSNDVELLRVLSTYLYAY